MLNPAMKGIFVIIHNLKILFELFEFLIESLNQSVHPFIKTSNNRTAIKYVLLNLLNLNSIYSLYDVFLHPTLYIYIYIYIYVSVVVIAYLQ